MILKHIPPARFLTVVAALAVLVAPGALSFDYGLDITTTTRVSSDLAEDSDSEFFNRDIASAWTEVPLGQRHLFQVRGGYAFSTDLPVELRLDRLSVRGNYQPTASTRFVTRAGRISLRDPSGLVLAHPVDGASLRMQYPRATARLGIGYTGLLFGPASSILVSVADAAVPVDEPFSLATPRVIGTAAVTLTDLIPRQEITLAGTFQEDLRPVVRDDRLRTPLVEAGMTTFDANAGGPVDTQYLSLGVRGGLTQSLFYQFWGTYNAGSMLSYVTDEATGTGVYESTAVSAFATSLGLTYFRPQLLSLRIQGRFTFTSGDSDHSTYFEGFDGDPKEAASTLYQPITETANSLIFSPRLGNVMFGEIHFGMRPFEDSRRRYLRNLQVTTGGYVFLRSSEGAVSATGVTPGTSKNYLGSEVDMGVTYRPFSDLGIGLSAGLFFPNAGDSSPMAETAQSPQFRARLSTSFSM